MGRLTSREHEVHLGNRHAECAIQADERLVVHAIRRLETGRGVVNPGQAERQLEIGKPLEQVLAVGNQGAQFLQRVLPGPAGFPDRFAGCPPRRRARAPPAASRTRPWSPWDDNAVKLGVVRFLVERHAECSRRPELAVAERALRGHLDRRPRSLLRLSAETTCDKVFDGDQAGILAGDQQQVLGTRAGPAPRPRQSPGPRRAARDPSGWDSESRNKGSG